MAGSPGFDVKLSGAMLLALTWIFICLILSGIFTNNGNDNVSDNNSFSLVMDGFSAFAGIHALSFSLIAIGWIMERSENLTEDKPINTFAEKRSKLRKMVVEGTDRDVEISSPSIKEQLNEMKKNNEENTPYYQINQEEDLVANLPPPRD